jgi:hypothetical protein
MKLRTEMGAGSSEKQASDRIFTHTASRDFSDLKVSIVTVMESSANRYVSLDDSY